jgi:hypothetical protein
MRALFEKASLVHHQHTARIAEFGHDIGTQFIADGIRVPHGAIQDPLDRPGLTIARLLGELPAVLAFGAAEQATQVGAGMAMRVLATKQGAQPCPDRANGCLGGSHRLQFY